MKTRWMANSIVCVCSDFGFLHTIGSSFSFVVELFDAVVILFDEIVGLDSMIGKILDESVPFNVNVTFVAVGFNDGVKEG